MNETIDERLQRIIHELLDGGITLAQAMQQFTRKYVTIAKQRSRGNATRAAKELGAHRNTVMKYVPSERAMRRREMERQREMSNRRRR